MKICNADIVNDEEKKVVLNGREYIIPADLPVKLMIRMMQNSNDLMNDGQNADLLEESVRIIFDLFRLKNDDMNWEDFDMSTAQYIQIVNFIGDTGKIEEESEKKT